MSAADPPSPVPDAPRRLLVVMPTWFGDCLMATPTLRALRRGLPGTHISAYLPAALAPLLEGSADVDSILPGQPKSKGGAFLEEAKQLKAGGFDAAVLLPNSMRSALLVRLAGIPRRIGYDRDGRGLLLTDRLIPRRRGRRFLPVPTLDYYLQLARYLGATGDDPSMSVAVSDEADRRAEALLGEAHGKPVVLLNPGAQKPAKRWPAERYASLADRCRNELGVAVAVTGSPAERPILQAVIASAQRDILDLPARGMDLHVLKAVMRRSAVLVTNDTGPLHLAAAAGIPVVTLFGPTTPEWTEIGYDRERMVIAPDAGQPESIRQITVDQVFEAVTELLQTHEQHDEYAAQHEMESPLPESVEAAAGA